MKSCIVLYALAIILRFALIFSDFQEYITERIEISNPINSWTRIVESCYRMNINVDPYSGDVLHESPLHLYFYKFIIDNAGKYLPVVFVLCDIMTAIFLYLFAKNYIITLCQDEQLHQGTYSEDVKEYVLQLTDVADVPFVASITYLFNPYIIFNCVGYATTIFLNLCLASFFYGISCGSIAIGVISLTLSSIQAFYPAILIIPLYLSIVKHKNSNLKASIAAIISILLLCVFVFSSYYVLGSSNFLKSTYGFILTVTDHRPNIGIFWYFFTDIFEQFRNLFLFSFQINVTILYLIPLTLKFRKDPVLLAMCFVIIIAIFKSFPAIGDFGFILSLLPCWKYMYNCMQQTFVSGVTIFTATTLAPVVWDLWISWGSANANFFFGSTLAFLTAHIFILTDLLFAYSKRAYLLKYGNLRTIHGKNAKLVLD